MGFYLLVIGVAYSFTVNGLSRRSEVELGLSISVKLVSDNDGRFGRSENLGL